MKYAQIIVNISHESVDHPFTYKIPASLSETIRPGMRVLVPFGTGNREMSGYVISLSDHADYPDDRIKSILKPEAGMVGIDDLFIRMAVFMHDRYGCTMNAALKTVLPVKKTVKEHTDILVKRRISKSEAEMMVSELLRKRQTAQATLLRELIVYDELPGSIITGKLMVSKQSIKSLSGKHLVTIEENVLSRNPKIPVSEKNVPPHLSEEQAAILDSYKEDLKAARPVRYLIHGITGAGKTEVYMRLIEECIHNGHQAIMLIPEIALSYQTLMRFYARFGERVTVINSKMSKGERYDQTERARRGEVDVVIGPRSALFMPFPSLGLIIVDEEQESGYKSETSPKYHVRDIAGFLQKETGCGIVYGSATPSLESYYASEQGDFKRFEMTKRLTGGSLPKVYVEDLREELKAGNKSIFSRRLHALMEERLHNNEQVMLFLNRRGYAGFVSCRSCGEVIKCPHCDISLSEHKGNQLICHYCGYTQPKIIKCPFCGAMKVAAFRAGTEQIEELVKKEFLTARTLRMDADTTGTKDSYESILEKFKNHEADVLIGTQMIVKGHDFKDVTLVGILAADMSLFAPDYRSAERTFDLITQAAGRAGRGDKPGEVVIQTYKPDHYAIVHASHQDYRGFYEEETFYRDMAGYPPCGHILSVMVSSDKSDTAVSVAHKMAGEASSFLASRGGTVIGPVEAPIYKLQDQYRMVFSAKGKDFDLLLKLREQLSLLEDTFNYRNLLVQYDLE